MKFSIQLWGRLHAVGEPTPDRFDRMEPPVQHYDIEIYGHDSLENIDLTTKNWRQSLHRSLQSGSTSESIPGEASSRFIVRRYQKVSRSQAVRHTTLRLDKHSRADDWEPYQFYRSYEYIPEHWIPINLYLFDKARSTRSSHAMINPPTDESLLKAVDAYFRSLESHNVTSSHTLPKESFEESRMDLSNSRGRLRRRARRFGQRGDTRENESSAALGRENSRYLPGLGQAGPPQLHGRARRKQRRHRQIGQPKQHSETPEHHNVSPDEQEDTCPANERASAIHAQLPARFGCLPLVHVQNSAKGLESRDTENNYLVVSVTSPREQRLLGCLVLPTHVLTFPDGESNDRRFARSESLRLDLSLAQNNAVPDIPNDYWLKFPSR